MTRLGPLLTLAGGAAVTAALAVLSGPAVGATAAGAITDPPPPAAASPPAADGATPAATPGPTAATPGPTATAPVAPRKADYAGRVRGRPGLIAVSVRGGDAIAYFCDGRTEAWFQGEVKDGGVTLDGFGGATVTAEFAGGRARGELTLDGKSWAYTAPAVTKPSGLYRATALVRGARLDGAWIYLPDGTRVGRVGLDGNLFPADIPGPGQTTVIYGAEIDPQDVDEFFGGGE
ncbi:hypothetical protein ABGB17_11275 [Sphaerisporangium sp. B11E5]|uniref:hypothetical protein n=1 Tax=Sphaerisporangium sp. B11E5 TaxID=3153563 RepID=UPI00325D537F